MHRTKATFRIKGLQKICNKVSHSSSRSGTSSQRSTDACSWKKQKKKGAEGTAIQNSLAKLQGNRTASTSSSVVLAKPYGVSHKQVEAVISSPQLLAVPKLPNQYKAFKIWSFVSVSSPVSHSGVCGYKYKPSS